MDQVEEVKTKVDAVELVGSYVDLKQAGRNFKGLCPFHQEKSPSFMVNPELQIYKCFGCGKGGDVITFVEEVEGVEFKEALEILADRVGVKLKFQKREGGDRREQLLAVNEAAVEYYHFLLTKHRVGGEARKYLKKRGIGEKVIETFRLGYALPNWDGLVKYLAGRKGYKLDLLEKAGLVVKSGQNRAYDRLRDRVVFPLIDHRGKVVGLAGRIMPGADEKAGAKYINSPETEIYHKSRMLYGFYQAKKAIREKDRMVLVEGETDMISSFVAGVSETAAVKGTALTEDQLRLISRLTKNLVLALDADGAGQAATKRSIGLAEKQGMYVKVVKVVGGKDPDDIARETPREWKKMVNKAMDVHDYYLQSAVEKHGVDTAEGKRKVSEDVAPMVAGIENEVVKAHFVKKMAGVLGVEVETVVAEVARVGRSVDLGREKQEEIKEQPWSLGMQILSLMMRIDEKEALLVAEKLVKSGIEGVVGKIMEKWLEKKENVVEFVKKLPEELREVAEVAYVREVDEEKVGRNIKDAVDEWEKRERKKKLGKLQKMLVEAENGGESEKVKKLRDQVMRLSKKMATADSLV